MVLKAVIYQAERMKSFQHQLWGYQIDFPDSWDHRVFDHRDGFSADPEAFLPGYQGEKLAQVLISGEWNSLAKPIYELWSAHLGKTAIMLGAKKMGGAVWRLAGAQGYEVEIALPQKSRVRLWAGILENGLLVLSMVAMHWKENKSEMEPLISSIISSLKYLKGVNEIGGTGWGLPLPSPIEEADPQLIIPDITDPEDWQAYRTHYPVGALQAFYTRELPNFHWQVLRYLPFPNSTGLGFARYIMEKAGRSFSLGLMPGLEAEPCSYIVLKETLTGSS
jgi:hypothetical protein